VSGFQLLVQKFDAILNFSKKVLRPVFEWGIQHG
jgi:hypothetical protein